MAKIKLQIKQRRAIALLLEDMSLDEIAQKVNVRPATIKRWFASEEFLLAYNKERKAAREYSSRELNSFINKALACAKASLGSESGDVKRLQALLTIFKIFPNFIHFEPNLIKKDNFVIETEHNLYHFLPFLTDPKRRKPGVPAYENSDLDE